ncbi:MAG: glutamate synthase central domain-containing protein, partial [Acidimicrobiales bacterium]
MREFDACGIGFVADAQGRASRAIVAAALHGLACVKHRGAAAADGLTSDGCGVLTPIPAALFGEGNGVIALFVRGADATTLVEDACAAEGVEVVDWRKPETDDTVLGHMAAETRPEILQAVIAPPTDSPYSDEVTAYRIRRHLTDVDGLYVVSCSYRTVVYKSLAAADHLADFYRDLADPRYEAAFTIFHQRFSTNTLPTWERAQPFRSLCHNGEINAIQGNRNRMLARSTLGTEEAGLGAESLFWPVLDDNTSDSGKLDEALELLTRGGRDIRHAVAMLVPEAWEHAVDLDPEIRGFYRYHSALMEPWDGPAGLIFTDGVGVGAALDRNGLRPLRYAICDDGLVVCSSEVGAVDVSGHGKVERGRLGPGQMLFVDPTRGVQRNDAVKERLAAANTFSHWAHDGFLSFGPGEPVMQVDEGLEARQAVHGYTQEELQMVLRPMGAEGKEPTFSMGDDSPLPPMAGRPRPVHHYLKQRFAQVTNPPIDPLREHRVMSLRTLLGPRAPILSEHEDATRLLRLESFLLYPDAVEQLAEGQTPFRAATLDATFPLTDGPDGLRAGVARLADEVEAVTAEGAEILVVSHAGADADRVPIPSVLAVGAAHHRLIELRRRSDVSVVVL